jgi:hypothetical protein
MCGVLLLLVLGVKLPWRWLEDHANGAGLLFCVIVAWGGFTYLSYEFMATTWGWTASLSGVDFGGAQIPGVIASRVCRSSTCDCGYEVLVIMLRRGFR